MANGGTGLAGDGDGAGGEGDDDGDDEVDPAEGGGVENEDDLPESAKQQDRRWVHPPWLQAQYRQHREWIKSTMDKNFKSTLYRPPRHSSNLTFLGLASFTLPHHDNFFLLSPPTPPKPEQLYNHRWFFWDPMALSGKTLSCPCCSKTLTQNGFPAQPRRVAGIDESWFLIGQRYRCRAPGCGKGFISWDSRIMTQLSSTLRDSFPFHRSHRGASHSSVVTFLRNVLGQGLGTKQFSSIIKTQHLRQYHMKERDYHTSILAHPSLPDQTFPTMSSFADFEGNSGFVATGKWFSAMNNMFMEGHVELIDQHTSMLSCEVAAADHSHKVRYFPSVLLSLCITHLVRF